MRTGVASKHLTFELAEKSATELDVSSQVRQRTDSPWRRSDVSQEETCKPPSRTVPWLEGQLEAAGANRAPAAPRLKSTE